MAPHLELRPLSGELSSLCACGAYFPQGRSARSLRHGVFQQRHWSCHHEAAESASHVIGAAQRRCGSVGVVGLRDSVRARAEWGNAGGHASRPRAGGLDGDRQVVEAERSRRLHHGGATRSETERLFELPANEQRTHPGESGVDRVAGRTWRLRDSLRTRQPARGARDRFVPRSSPLRPPSTRRRALRQAPRSKISWTAFHPARFEDPAYQRVLATLDFRSGQL